MLARYFAKRTSEDRNAPVISDIFTSSVARRLTVPVTPLVEFLNSAFGDTIVRAHVIKFGKNHLSPTHLCGITLGRTL